MLFAAIMAAQCTFAGVIPVKNFKYSGPLAVKKPVMVDSVDICKQKFSVATLLDTPVSLSKAAQGSLFSGDVAPAAADDYAIHLLQFKLTSDGYTKATVKVEKLKHYQLFVDGEKSDGNLTLIPSTHDVVIKYLSVKGEADSLKVSLCSDNNRLLSVSADAKRRYSLADVLNGKHFNNVMLSADGRYLITASSEVLNATKTLRNWTLTDLKTGRTLLNTEKSINWVPNSTSYYYTKEIDKGYQLVTVDAASGRETVIVEKLPEGQFTFSPKGDYLIVSRTMEGPRDDRDVHQFVHPDDRMPGWRDRTVLEKLDLATGVTQQLTFGYRPIRLLDISSDGRHILYMVNSSRLTKRPTTLYSICRLDLTTMQNDVIVSKDGFIGNAKFSPDAKDIVVIGTPDAFGGIGRNLPADRTGSMYDYQLFMVNCATHNVKPLTQSFNPSVEEVAWNVNDGKIYFTALNRDYVSLYRIDVKSGRIEPVAAKEENVKKFALSDGAPVMAYYGQGASNTDRLYTLDLKSGKSTLLEDLQAERFADVDFGECKEWNFVNSRGDTIYGRYYLPPHFDKSKKYPMIVNYYGGCTPTSRNFESRYPHHLYAAMGYVVYVVQPSGATGFGQEFASRHVNTAGEGPAQDIIEGTKQFCSTHDFVDATKLGCIGASYGGFMTQYIQTKTDLFAAAISHAGISDHVSYWGEGYWGYSYSEVSMANSYPWSHRELFIDRSPLFNAEKIHTPLLFLHGADDHNVPVGESIQMYNALRLLDRPTALVVVEGEDHHILTYDKRIKWQNTIFAWFAKWLQNDSAWWDSMYDKTPQP